MPRMWKGNAGGVDLWCVMWPMPMESECTACTFNMPSHTQVRVRPTLTCWPRPMAGWGWRGAGWGAPAGPDPTWRARQVRATRGEGVGEISCPLGPPSDHHIPPISPTQPMIWASPCTSFQGASDMLRMCKAYAGYVDLGAYECVHTPRPQSAPIQPAESPQAHLQIPISPSSSRPNP